MKRLMSITSNSYDRRQYTDHEELSTFYHNLECDGLEMLVLEETGEDSDLNSLSGEKVAMDDILTAEDVIGIHLPFVNCWVDFWLQNEERLMEEYGSEEWIIRNFKGLTKEDFTGMMKRALAVANRYEPEYLVYHISECTAYESITGSVTDVRKRGYYYTDAQVVDAAISYINTWCADIRPDWKGRLPWLLLENLWHSGLNLQDPSLIARLVEGIHYPRVGIMLDVGHLIHCNPKIRTSEEGVEYIRQILDRIEDLSVIKGIHLHHTLSGEWNETCKKTPKPDKMDYMEKLCTYFGMIYQIDSHQPFTSTRIQEILDLVCPEYLVYELQASSKEEYAQLVRCQQSYLQKAVSNKKAISNMKG